MIFWQHVQQEAAYELVSVERHHLGLVVRAIILPTEADTTVLAAEEPTVTERPKASIRALWECLLGEGLFYFSATRGILQIASAHRIVETKALFRRGQCCAVSR